MQSQTHRACSGDGGPRAARSASAWRGFGAAPRPTECRGVAQVGRLVEAAMTKARSDEAGPESRTRRRSSISAPRSRIKRAEPAGERSPAVVLQRVDDRPQRAVVGADRARSIDEAREPPAARTAIERTADRAPRRQRVAAAIADRRRDWQNRRPARRADRTGSRMIEELLTGRARRREEDGDERVAGR